MAFFVGTEYNSVNKTKKDYVMKVETQGYKILTRI